MFVTHLTTNLYHICAFLRHQNKLVGHKIFSLLSVVGALSINVVMPALIGGITSGVSLLRSALQ
jgi:hypothetical protein